MTDIIVAEKDYQAIVERWLRDESEGNPFPVDFEFAWQIAGYADKGKGKRRLSSEKSGLIEGQDYLIEKGVPLTQSGKSELYGSSADQIVLSCDAFKHFCLLARTEQGRSIRQYFIESEKKWKLIQSQPTPTKPTPPELSRLEILKMALDSEEKRIEAETKLAIAAEQIEVMAPLAKLGECMATHEKDTKTIGEIAQSYKIGRIKFFTILREIKFIQQNSTRPYQSHIDAGHCEVKMVARPHAPEKLDPVCVVTMKGQSYIAKKLVELEKLVKTEVLLEGTVALA